MKKIYILFLLLSLIIDKTYAQINNCVFEARDIINSPDSNFFILGLSNDSVMLIKMDTLGNFLWQQVYQPGSCFSILELDNYLYFTGTEDSTSWNSEIVLYKTDLNGNLIWKKLWQNPWDDWPSKIIKTNTNELVLTGGSSTLGATCGSENAFLLKTDTAGNIIWLKGYCNPLPWDQFANSVCNTYDNGFLMTGYYYSFPTGLQMLAIKTNSTGDTIWTNHYPGPGGNIGFSLVQNIDSSFIIAAKGNSCPLVLNKLSSNGVQLMQKSYPVCPYGNTEWGLDIIASPDSGYFLISGQYNPSGIHYDTINKAFIFKIDSLLDSVYYKTYNPGLGYTTFRSAVLALGNGLIAVGKTNCCNYYSNSFYSPISNLYVVRTNAFGDTLWTKNYGCGYVVTSTNNVEDVKNKIFVFPNPFTSSITISFQQENINLTSLTIKNILGQTLFFKPTQANSNNLKPQIKLDLNFLPQGIYFLEINLGGERMVRKIVKQ